MSRKFSPLARGTTMAEPMLLGADSLAWIACIWSIRVVKDFKAYWKCNGICKNRWSCFIAVDGTSFAAPWLACVVPSCMFGALVVAMLQVEAVDVALRVSLSAFEDHQRSKGGEAGIAQPIGKPESFLSMSSRTRVAYLKASSRLWSPHSLLSSSK